MIIQPFKQSGEKIFNCDECNKKGKYEDGAYVCASCNYDVHLECAHQKNFLNEVLRLKEKFEQDIE